MQVGRKAGRMHAPPHPEQFQPRTGGICEPFMGSGTTLIAAETTGRTCPASS